MSPNRALLRHPAGWIATGFGSGFAPKASGTVGSLAALLPWWFLRELPPWAYLAVCAGFFALSVWAAQWVIDQIRVDDPGLVVADEWVGLWLTLFLLPDGLHWIAIGFAVFRFFDILKPWPVSWADQKLHGGFGSMLDDALAGVYGWLTVSALVSLSSRGL